MVSRGSINPSPRGERSDHWRPRPAGVDQGALRIGAGPEGEGGVPDFAGSKSARKSLVRRGELQDQRCPTAAHAVQPGALDAQAVLVLGPLAMRDPDIGRQVTVG